MIEAAGDVTSFFRCLVSPRLEEPLLGYVLSILEDPHVPTGPVCLLLGDFSERRVISLKTAGDGSLFVSGFLLRREPPPEYYAQLGSSAYGELADRIRDPLFRTMASRFSHVQRVLGDVRRDCLLQDQRIPFLLRPWLLGSLAPLG